MRDLSIIPAIMDPVADPDLQREVEFFMKWGYLVVEDAISMETVAMLREALTTPLATGMARTSSPISFWRRTMRSPCCWTIHRS